MLYCSTLTAVLRPGRAGEFYLEFSRAAATRALPLASPRSAVYPGVYPLAADVAGPPPREALLPSPRRWIARPSAKIARRYLLCTPLPPLTYRELT